MDPQTDLQKGNEFKRFQADLESSRESGFSFYQALMQQSYEAQALVSVESQEILEINRRFTELFGYSLPEDSPLYLKNIVVELQDAREKRYSTTLKQQDFLLKEPLILRKKNGSLITVERTGTLIDRDKKYGLA